MTRPERVSRPAFERLLMALSTIGGIVLLLMMVHITADVFMKYVFNAPLQGTLEIVSSYYMVLAVFLPLPLVEWRRQAILVDVVFMQMPRWMKLGCVVVVLAVMAALYGAFAWQTWNDAVRAFTRNEIAMGPAQTVIWPSRFVLPLGFGLAGLIALWHLAGVVIGWDRDSWLRALDSSGVE
jgi:TRAP-type C4-dicarboxylate transport system permease small subunit